MKNRGCIADALLERLGPPRDERMKQKVTPVWRHLADLGRHLTSSWAPTGFLNPPFWHQDAQEIKKMVSRKGCQKTYDFVKDFYMKKVRF